MITLGSFAEVIRDYLASPAFAKLGPSAQGSYRRNLMLAQMPECLGEKTVDQIGPADVQEFLDALSETPGKQSGAKTAIKAVEKWARVRRRLGSSITDGTITIPSDGGHEPWSFSQVEAAIKHARSDLARVVMLAVHTGQRGSDIVKMRWSDLEEQHGRQGIVVSQQKTGKSVRSATHRLWVPLTNELSAAMATWERKPPFFIVLSPNGNRYSRQWLSKEWNVERDTNAALKEHSKAGLVIHGLRATAVVRARKSGASVLEIASMYGMSEPMVARYSRLADQAEMALAVVHRLDNSNALNSAKKAVEK